jgi:hypothetical protein
MTKPMPRRPPLSTDQRRFLRDELHQIVDTVLDNWPDIDHQISLMGSGYPTSTLGSRTSGTGGGGTSTLVESAAHRAFTKQSDWITHLVEWIGHSRNLYDELKKIQSATDQEKAEMLKRQNSVELCVECNEPILGKIKRLDGQPYHHPDDQPGDNGSCWWKAYNRTRGNR